MSIFYRLHFDSPIEWERVEIHSNGCGSSELHLSKAARDGLSLSPRAACSFLNKHDRYVVPGTNKTVCLRCGKNE